MRALSWLLVVSLTACARAVTPPSAPVPAPAAPRYELIGQGLSADFPSPPEQGTVKNATSAPSTTYALVASAGPMEFALMRVSTNGRDRKPDAVWLDSIMTRYTEVTRNEKIELAGFMGREFQGITSQDRAISGRVYIVGDSALMVLATAERGKLDTAAAQRFLASVRLELPWTVYVSAEEQFSVAAPSIAVELDPPPVSGVQLQGRVFYVGGVDRLIYFVTSAERDRTTTGDASEDDLLDAGVTAMLTAGATLIWQGPIELDGARGRDVLARIGDDFVRGRLVVTEGVVYTVAVSGRTKEAVTNPEANRFLGSLQWY